MSASPIDPQTLANIAQSLAQIARGNLRVGWAPNRSPNLPQRFDGQEIKFRIPYTMPGELALDLANTPPFSTQFPAATFLHNVDKPFEIHRMIPRLTLLGQDESENDVVIIPADPKVVTGLEKCVRLRIDDTSKNEKWTKAACSIEDLVRNDRVWTMDAPYTIVRSEGFNVEVDVQRFAPNPLNVATIACTSGEVSTQACTTVTKIRVDIDFQGYLIVIAPPSETR